MSSWVRYFIYKECLITLTSSLNMDIQYHEQHRFYQTLQNTKIRHMVPTQNG